VNQIDAPLIAETLTTKVLADLPCSSALAILCKILAGPLGTQAYDDHCATFARMFASRVETIRSQ
jgi:hypothetical protein